MPEAGLLSNSRTPAVLALVNGSELPGVTQARIASNNHHAADRFSLRVALSATNPVFWAGVTQALVELRLGIDGAWQSVIQGEVDSVEIDWLRHELRLEGRDLSAALIETRTQESFQNRTSSEIAQILAARHGLTAVVTPTTTPVGRYYQLEHDRIVLNQFAKATTEWDLLVFLAQQEGFDLFVQGNELHFQQPVPQSPPTMTVTPDDLIDLRLDRALTLARDIVVTVKSWNSKQSTAFTQTARAGKGTPSGSGGTPQTYALVRPNLTPDQALQLAQSLLAELSQHERVVSFTMPGELTLTPRSIVALAGTGTAFDQSYFVAEVDRTLSVAGGFVQQVRVKNASPAASATIPADAPLTPGLV